MAAQTLEEFQENYDGAPYELCEFADGASEVTDCPELKEAADAYLAAKRKFEIALSHVDVEIG